MWSYWLNISWDCQEHGCCQNVHHFVRCVNLVKWSYISCLFTVGVVLTQPEDSTFILINSIMYQLSIKMCQCPIAKIALLRFCLHPWFRNNPTACTRDNPFYCISPLSTSLEQAISVNNEPFAILKIFLSLGQTVQKIWPTIKYSRIVHFLLIFQNCHRYCEGKTSKSKANGCRCIS